ncbi:precorrin-3B C(17)-methyltransferase [Paraburkholderia domus]|jgi:precorrin-3B C17-methyltransferase|uniref:Siroheme synthase n=1 Tax=Paraburkholderia domus TaxID=2793075 RepID=A0A9N8QV57_9BURK|nr:precorrin-3B C(17)-methyltransferase [Paraburkholderia domus]MBK5048329.1 precorrin-3B C(17)-methyltransferase [Burkholderia sp. R-70006]MBK5060558.1 precorrin-3B C(17)-methyltransferase [Burkholderia sp. R-70199]MBK5164651.1 precorrin-3B C(17)-methyltransferase [Burkholderia sp. R-70211]MBK5181911.1 precorrin-3B C(17)-methyltransferase [Burkholderia sp. R-69749]MCI0147887.1 precorrin-3B C(17)-methyltransferase [Paraburkholderia sediminicola]
MTPPAIVILGAGALATARRIQALYAGSQVHALQGRVEADVSYTELRAHLCDLYARGTPIIALCAAGIVIRCVAALLSNKGVEPPVLAVAEDGSAVVPLLGGLAGVNVMAREIAAELAVSPAITTSGELRFGTCVLNPPEGYALADIAQGKRFVSDLLAGETTRIEGEAPWLDCAQLPRSESARLAIRVTPRAWDGRDDELVIHPRSVVAAVTVVGTDTAPGANADADADGDADAGTGTSAHPATNAGLGAKSSPDAQTNSGARITALVREALDAHGLAALSLAALLASPEHMANPALADAAASLNVPLRFAQPRPEDGEPPGNLLHAALRVPYEMLHNNADAGVALALAPLAIDPDTIGRARGRLTVIGLGPGSADLMVPAARTALNEATDILGYETYVKMAGPLRADQRVHGTDNREEMQRARHAFELASTGRSVVMVSSGDPGVFAMAAAVLEALEEGGSTNADWRAVQLAIVPGVSAAMATAAQAGAPLGHDFCMLSLSDNLKPWTIIETRLRHAAEADLVMAFYNPISRARPWQLDRALDIVREYRSTATKVVLGRDIGRSGSTLRTITLGELRSSDVDMRTMVIVGSSTTRAFANGVDGEWVYTPRWYE